MYPFYMPSLPKPKTQEEKWKDKLKAAGFKIVEDVSFSVTEKERQEILKALEKLEKSIGISI